MARKNGWHPFLGNKTDCDMLYFNLIFYAFWMRFGLDKLSTFDPSRTHANQNVVIVIPFPIVRPISEKKIFIFLRTKRVNQFTQHAMKSAQLWCRFAHTWYVVVRSAITSFGDDVDQHIAVLFPLNKSLLIRKARFSAPGAVHCHCVNLHRKPGNPKKSNADGQSHCLDAHINEAHLIRCELIKIQTPTSRVLIYKFD